MENEASKTMEVVELIPAFDISWSPTIGKLVDALAKAQLKFKPILKQNENAAFTRGEKKSFYADLATYIDATQEALASEGLVVMQWPDVSPGAKSMSLISFLAHSSGEWTKGRLTLPALGRDGFTAQSCGSAITYARRYSYAAITGCAAEDDDANSASGRGSRDAAQEVGKAKIDALKAGKRPAEPITEGASLFYTWHDESQTAEIMGDEGYKSANRDLLKPLYRADVKAIVASADQLEYLKLMFEERKVPFTPLKAPK